MVVCCLLFLLLAGCVPERETVVPVTRRSAEATTIPVVPTAMTTLAPDVTATAARTSLSQTSSIDSLDPSAVIRVPFVRDGSIYLYEDGIEKLVAQPAQQTTQQACFNLVYPFLSPDGKYLAYIEQVGEPPNEYSGCSDGFLRIVDSTTGINSPTGYKISYFRWTPANLLNFTPVLEIQQTTQTYSIRNIYYDLASQSETVFETVIDWNENAGAQTMLSAAFPSDDLNKVIRYQDDKYYLVDNASNEETFLFDRDQVAGFLGWSPEGRYALFESAKELTEAYVATEFVVDTQNPGATASEIFVGRGAAGGDFPTGRKWYFEKGFVAYCREELYYVDGSPPLQLTNDSGGGCHNEEGFVATSPGGEYAFVKFQDRFELHSRDGNVTVVAEAEPILKGRGMPKNFIWVNDDYLVIFERTYSGDYGTGESPKVYLFDRQANVIKPLIENAYLTERAPY
jgi:hypothetical protein